MMIHILNCGTSSNNPVAFFTIIHLQRKLDTVCLSYSEKRRLPAVEGGGHSGLCSFLGREDGSYANLHQTKQHLMTRDFRDAL